ncbi:MAG: OsmC family protein [Myxococcales bacterium]|nr:OsmC family protein [Myxococcales bacterium]
MTTLNNPITTRVKWVEKTTFLGTDSRGHGVMISSADDEPGVSAMQMLLLGLGACSMYDVVNILQKQRQPLGAVEVSVSGERGEEYPRPWVRIHMQFSFTGTGLDNDKIERAIALSTEKYCGVHGTLVKSAEITHAFTVQPNP